MSLRELLAISAFLCICTACGVAFARNAERWQALKVQAEARGDAETLRRLRYVGQAGTLRNDQGVPYKASCCGEADAYEADDFATDADGNLYAILTCNDPKDCEEVKGKTPRPPGSSFKIPPQKMLTNFDPVNDTGHGWVWLSNTSTDGEGNPVVYCYAFPSGN